MGIAECMHDARLRGLIVQMPARLLLHGSLRLEETVPTSPDEVGWVRPWRLGERQVRALGSCTAWHPGLYSQMARATSGVLVEFTTDAEEVALEVRLDPEPRGTAAQLELVDVDGVRRPHDGVACECDGRPMGCVLPGADDLAGFLLAGDAPAPGTSRRQPAGSIRALPGLAPERHVRLWLPCLRGCEVRDVLCDGTYIRPVSVRPTMLVLGDSICQGFVSGDPALTWPALVGERLGLDVVNQGIGGQVFQATSLADAPALVSPARIVVALGANYRFEPCRSQEVARDVHAFLDQVVRLWPKAACWVLTPLWHSEERWPTHPRSCFAEVAGIIEREVARHDGMVLVDGSDLLDHDPTLLADACDHPNARGFAQMGERIVDVMRDHVPIMAQREGLRR